MDGIDFTNDVQFPLSYCLNNEWLHIKFQRLESIDFLARSFFFFKILIVIHWQVWSNFIFTNRSDSSKLLEWIEYTEHKKSRDIISYIYADCIKNS